MIVTRVPARGALATLDVHELTHGCEKREATNSKEVARDFSETLQKGVHSCRARGFGVARPLTVGLKLVRNAADHNTPTTTRAPFSFTLTPQTANLAPTSCSTCLQDFPESVPGMNSPGCVPCGLGRSQGHHRSEQSGGTSMGRGHFALIRHTRPPPRQTHLQRQGGCTHPCRDR